MGVWRDCGIQEMKREIIMVFTLKWGGEREREKREGRGEREGGMNKGRENAEE